ncbi:MAG: pyridoxamine kinase [Acutalibacteraceae bacterium]
MKKIAVINDLSGFGKCSLTAAIPIISALGVQCCPLVTSVLSNQTGYDSFYMRDFTDDMRPCMDEWKKLDVHFDAILSGFIANSRQGEIISEFIDTFADENTLVVVDPVMADDGELCKCYDDKSVRAIYDLCQKADIITPNLTELCLLCGESYSKIIALENENLLKKIEQMSKEQSGESGKTVITTGICLGKDEIANSVFENGRFDVIRTPRSGESFSGTGDIFSSFITAQSVKGVPMKKATEQAAGFILEAIETTVKDGFGENKHYEANGTNFEKILYKLGNI